MAINGVNSFGTSYYTYQAAINNMRLSQALSRNPRASQAYSGYGSKYSSSRSTAMQSNISFAKQYSTSMTDLMGAANELRSSNRGSVLNDLTVTSTDTSIATAKERLTVRDQKDIQLDIQQVAQAQLNVSDGVRASAKADSDMNFAVDDGSKTVNVRVSAVDNNGAARTNADMLKEAAEQINRGNNGVTASVVQKDGVASLQLESKSTGADNTFRVSGQMGAAAGVENVQAEAANAKYSVSSNGQTMQFESRTNEVTVDSTRIGVTLKGTGQVTISSGVDVDKAASALDDLVKSYNSSLKFLNDNYGRGTGVGRQLRNMASGLGSDQSLEKMGITVNKDATLSFDKGSFVKSMKESPSQARSLISNVNNMAERAYAKGVTGVNVSSSSLVNGDVSSTASKSITNPYNVFAMYSRSGAYNMSNYYAVGTMMNYLI
ncbi:MAG: flagellar filament capping protein FliD [Lachnospiraceae bacterium]|nr:flagellar filament capping protein FliD [Lachnospiraceae bacterium]